MAFVLLGFHANAQFFDDTKGGNDRTYQAGMLPEGAEIVIDGMMSDKAWSAQEVVFAQQDTFLINPNNSALEYPSSPFDIVSQYKAVWDNDFLYLFFNITDDVVLGLIDPNISWHSDHVELYFNVDPESTDFADNTSSQLRFNFSVTEPEETFDAPAKGFVLTDDANTEGLEYAWKATDDGYDMEIKMPWSAVVPDPSVVAHPFEVFEGSEIRFEAQTADADDSTRMAGNNPRYREHIAAWNSRDHRSHSDPFTFGTMRLAGEITIVDKPLNNDEQYTVAVYPNSASEYINIDVVNAENAQVSIVNMAGVQVKQLALANLKNQIDISDLGRGVYQFIIYSNGVREAHTVLVD
ncbi:hypothetical protein PEDI_47110 [Persicobacter diffluens]|uniref:Secretion system C-terminal sorting domain-containing protein n=2 Tax=Persicobacter diffluens TaxID=981 RepID=A0AAN4W3D7_9BACT|nr:hypothetical protein PEDI_47110 [Persicobacter diffluens]